MITASRLIPVTIKTRDDIGGPIVEYTVPGEQIQPGLAITPQVAWGGYTGDWTITHVPSGYRLGASAGCLWCAQLAARHDLAGIDWTRSSNDLEADDTARNLVRMADATLDACDATGH